MIKIYHLPFHLNLQNIRVIFFNTFLILVYNFFTLWPTVCRVRGGTYIFLDFGDSTNSALRPDDSTQEESEFWVRGVGGPVDVMTWFRIVHQKYV